MIKNRSLSTGILCTMGLIFGTIHLMPHVLKSGSWSTPWPVRQLPIMVLFVAIRDLPLLVVLTAGHLECLKLLTCCRQYKPNELTKDKATPAYFAAQEGQ